MILDEMSKGKHNVFIPVADGYYVTISGEPREHKLVGFVVHNPDDMPPIEFHVSPVIIFDRGNEDVFILPYDNETPF